MVSMDQIEQFSERIRSEYHPDRVVLFGSYARGNPTVDSDVDLLVVLPFDGKAAYKAAEMRLELLPPFPIDLIVRTPEKIRERLEMGDDFIREIMEEGRVLYEADDR